MNIHFLESKDNPKIKHLRALIEQNNYRKKHKQTVIEGTHLCLAYLEKQQPFAIFTTEDTLSHPDFQKIQQLYHKNIFIISQKVYKELSTLGESIACLTVVDIIPQDTSSIDFNIDTLILENVQDPGNVGTLLRSAAAANIKQIICTQGTASLWSPRVIRAGMGAHFSLSCFENVDLENILNHFKIPVLATSLHQAKSLYDIDLRQPLVWVLGNEGQGVSPFTLQHTQNVKIPQPGGQESLNVAIAGSICFFEMVRQRLS